MAMIWTRDQDGHEVDENGYLREAVEAWSAHGIYPPPMVGSPNNPEVVRLAKRQHERRARMSPEARQRAYAADRQFMQEFTGARATEASKTS